MVYKQFRFKNVCFEILPFDGESHSGELSSQNLCQALI
jgi:hypothetical protein